VLAAGAANARAAGNATLAAAAIPNALAAPRKNLRREDRRSTMIPSSPLSPSTTVSIIRAAISMLLRGVRLSSAIRFVWRGCILPDR
jgi:hypothetical protein